MSGIGNLLVNKSVRIIVTMGMPAVAYRFFYRSHSVKSLQRNILAFVGAGPIFTTFIGLVDHMNEKRVQKLFDKMKHLGRSGR
jgi:putative NADPH-quinone reductase